MTFPLHATILEDPHEIGELVVFLEILSEEIHSLSLHGDLTLVSQASQIMERYGMKFDEVAGARDGTSMIETYRVAPLEEIAGQHVRMIVGDYLTAWAPHSKCESMYHTLEAQNVLISHQVDPNRRHSVDTPDHRRQISNNISSPCASFRIRLFLFFFPSAFCIGYHETVDSMLTPVSW